MALLHVDFYSEILGMSTEMDVILPQPTHGQIGIAEGATQGKWPVLYLLHGMSDDNTIWQRRTSIERYAADYNLAVIMPTTYLGWYTDMYRGNDYFTFITEELPAICRSMFPNISTERKDTFVAGLSMGGYGALKCGLSASHVFSHAAALSGALDVASSVEHLPVQMAQFWEDIFGPLDKLRGSSNDLLVEAEKLAPEDRPKVFVWCGTEDFLYQQNLTMRGHLQKLGYDLTYTETPGDHSWGYWDREIQNVLKWLPVKEVQG